MKATIIALLVEVRENRLEMCGYRIFNPKSCQHFDLNLKDIAELNVSLISNYARHTWTLDGENNPYKNYPWIIVGPEEHAQGIRKLKIPECKTGLSIERTINRDTRAVNNFLPGRCTLVRVQGVVGTLAAEDGRYWLESAGRMSQFSGIMSNAYAVWPKTQAPSFRSRAMELADISTKPRYTLKDIYNDEDDRVAIGLGG